MKFRSRLVSTSLGFLGVVLLASGTFTTEASAACANIEEMFMDSLHVEFDGDLGYAMELGLQYDSGGGMITSVSVTPPSGPLVEFFLDAGDSEFETFDGNTLDPDELTGMGYDLSTLRTRYPDGTYTFTIDDADSECPDDTVDVDFTFSAPNGDTQPLVPTFGETINSGRPTFVSVNTCTDCNCREASIESTADEAVSLSWDPSFTIGQRPNTIRFADFFGLDAGGNEGTGGDISATGLPAGEDYLLFSTVGICEATTELSCGGGDESCQFFSGGFEIDIRPFSVSNDLATSADLNEAELFITELVSKGATTGIPEDVGFYVEAFLEGTNFTDATLYVPNMGSVSVTPESDGDNEFEFFDGPYNTHAEALEVFPLTDGESKYVLMVDGGRASAVLDFNPVEPNGKMTLTELSDGDTISSTPTFNTNSTCTNCTILVVLLEDFLTDGEVLDSEAEVFGNPVAPGPRSFVVPDDFDSGLVSLDPGDYLVTVESLNEIGLGEGPSGPMLVKTAGEDGFSYFAFDAKVDIIRVPEPSLLAMQIASLVGVALLVRRRRHG